MTDLIDRSRPRLPLIPSVYLLCKLIVYTFGIRTLTSTSPMTSKPPTPQNFFGREAELTYIVETIFNNVGTCPARIAILGPGGYGKTTLANAVLNHDHVVTHFGNARYFVTCENASMPSALISHGHIFMHF
jgi:hypothetical protein